MKRSLILAEFLATPWALAPEHLAAFSSMLHRWSAGEVAAPEVMAAIAQDIEARTVKRDASIRAGGGNIAVLPFYGVVTQRGNMANQVSGPGSVSTQQFSGNLRAALADESVGQILIDINSPGGSVYGVAELAAELLAARGQKPVVAIANSLAASAAYWIGCAASEFYVTPSGEVGSIGVLMAHQDRSAAMEQAGIKTTFIQAGKYKTEANPFQPLDEEAQAHLQSRVDDYYQSFVAGVAKGRGVGVDQVRNDMGQGRTFNAKAALAAQMIDGIATFDQVIHKMQQRAKTSAPSASRLAHAERELSLMG